MPKISKIRFTNVVYDGGQKRYLDTTFRFDGYNGILLLENGAGKTVFVQTLVQAVLPHARVARRRIQDTLLLSNSIAHIGVEWILAERPRRYGLTLVSLFLNSQDQLASQELVAEYGEGAELNLESLPLTKNEQGRERPASREEMAAFARSAAESSMTVRFFSENDTLASYSRYLEEHFQLVEAEWRRIAVINETEGGVEAFFENCRTTAELTDRLLIPVIEEGMAGNESVQGGNDFVALFSSQREHLRQQLQVEKSLHEMEGVQRELAICTTRRREQQQAEQALLEKSGVLKAYYLAAEAGRERTEQEGLLLEERQRGLQADLAEAERALAVCRAAKDKEIYEACRSEAQAAQQAAEAAEQEAQAIQLRMDNLQYAAKRTRCRQAQADIAQLTKELQEQSLSPEAAELAARLEKNSAYLHGWFAAEEARLQREAEQLQAAKKEREAERQEAKDRAARCEQELLQAEQSLSSQDGQVRALQQQKEQLEQTLFPNNLQHSPEQQVKLWQEEQQRSSQELADSTRDREFYQVEAEKCRSRLAALEAELGQTNADLAATRQDMALIDSDCARIIPLLSRSERLLGLATDTASLYQQSTYLLGQLEDSQVLLAKEKEELDTAHRQACHQLDRYGRLQEFTADPLLEEILAELAPDFVYLQSGGALFRQYRLELSAEELLERYPLWAVTVVTDAADVARLEQRLAAWRDRLTEPVVLVSDQELRGFVAGSGGAPLGVRHLLPGLWQSLETAHFRQWLAELQAHAEESKASLRSKERELREAEELQQALRRLLREHPAAEYRELQAAEKRLAERLEALQHEQQAAREQQETCRLSLEKLAELILAQRGRLDQLGYRLQRAEQYFDLHRQHLALLAETSSLRARRDSCRGAQEQARQELEGCEAAVLELQLRLTRQEAEHQQLREREFFAEVQEAPLPAEPVRESYQTLAQARRRLQAQLEGMAESRRLLEEKLRHAQADAAQLAKDMEALRRNAVGELAEELAWPGDGEAQLQTLESRRTSQRQALQRTAAELGRARSKADKAEANWERSVADYRGKYQTEPEDCPEPRQAEARLQARLPELQQALQATFQALQDNQAELKRLQALLSELEKASVRFGFLVEAVTPAILQLEQSDGDSLRQAVAPLLPQVEALFGQASELREKTRRAADAFVRYCEQSLTQERMRRHMVEGMRSKESYAEYLEWQTRMVGNINGTIRVLEGERENHAKEIDSIIRQMELHLAEVCHGLRELAAKTRLRTAAGTKDVYTVQLPVWNQAAARFAIRQQLHELSQRLERDEFKNDQGQEDTAKIQAELTRQLTSQSLLRRILGDNAIKIKCRKATYQATFSEHPYTWEESNRWSGGEMWSKNMALFLGCLNYLAEKWGGSHHAGAGTTRTVIADNPFGKASSEHVLQPVFFIAQQLGFQIIALTAHEDGSFIRTYFPVVYSCKFRPLAAGQGTVLTPECQLQAAFFAEKEPEAMERLQGPPEQGSLF